MKVVVTGGSGFIGSHVVEEWIDHGAEVHVLDLWRSPRMERLVEKHGVRFHAGDLRDAKTLRTVFEGADIVYHLGSILGTSESIDRYDPIDVADTNVVGTCRILAIANKLGVKRVVYPSTPDVPWLNPYKITKQAAEKFCQMYYKEFGLNTVVLKLTNIYGPRERWIDADVGAPFNYQKVVPTFIVNALRGDALPVFGDGTQTAEYVYVTDVARAFYLAGIAPEEHVAGEVIPIGTGESIDVLSLARLVLDMTGSSSEIQMLPMRRGEVHVHISVDTGPARRKLNFTPKVSLHDGLKRSIAYYTAVLNGQDDL